MAIYTGGMRQQQEARAASARIAKQQKKAGKAEGKRKGRSKLFGSIGGALLGAAAVGLTGLTGGLAAPLVMGVASSLGKKWADEASKGSSVLKALGGKGLAKKLKSPGQVSKIKAGGEFGYGHSEAKSMTEALQESRKTDWDMETMAGDIGSAYLSAGLSGELGAAKGLVKGDLSFGQALTTGSKDAWKFGGLQGAKEGVLGLIPGQEGVATDPETALTSEELGQSAFVSNGGGAMESYDPSIIADGTAVSEEILPDVSYETNFAQGGQVMDQNTLIGLTLLAEMGKQKKTYDDTPLEEGQLTIAEYFNSQGKTLGGNNTQSIAQMMGR